MSLKLYSNKVLATELLKKRLYINVTVKYCFQIVADVLSVLCLMAINPLYSDGFSYTYSYNKYEKTLRAL